MNILLLVSKQDAKSKLFNKSLLEFTLSRLEPKHRVFVYSLDSTIEQRVGSRFFSAKNNMDALRKFADKQDVFMVISRLAICDINFDNLINYHNNHDKSVTLVCKNFVKDKSIPIYQLDDTKSVTAVTRRRFADCGIYLFKNKVNLNSYKNIYTIITDAIKNKILKGFVHKGYWWTAANIRRRDNGNTFNTG